MQISEEITNIINQIYPPAQGFMHKGPTFIDDITEQHYFQLDQTDGIASSDPVNAFLVITPQTRHRRSTHFGFEAATGLQTYNGAIEWDFTQENGISLPKAHVNSLGKVFLKSTGNGILTLFIPHQPGFRIWAEGDEPNIDIEEEEVTAQYAIADTWGPFVLQDVWGDPRAKVQVERTTSGYQTRINELSIPNRLTFESLISAITTPAPTVPNVPYDHIEEILDNPAGTSGYMLRPSIFMLNFR